MWRSLNMIIFNLIAALYLLSGLWCATQAERSMSFLGYEPSSQFSVGEFITVYGGLQLGIGLAMLIVNWLPQYFGGTLLFAAVFSVVLLLVRIMTLVTYGFFEQGNIMAGVELFIAVSLVAVFVRYHFAG